MKAAIFCTFVLAAYLAGPASANSDYIEFREGCWITSQIDSNETVIWTGECKDRFAHGDGKAVWRSTNSAGETDEVTFDGELAYGVPQGQGKLTYWDGDVYEGEIKNGEPHGYGVFRQRFGSTYEGYWQEGHEHGSATVTNEEGEKFNCLYRRGAYGTCWLPVIGRECKIWWGLRESDPSGAIEWSGACRDGKAHGEGIAIWRGGDELEVKFEGAFADGAMNGFGKLTVTAGSARDEDVEIYTGHWMNSYRHGAGTLDRFSMRSTSDHEFSLHYEGDFAFNQFDGNGLLSTKITQGSGFQETQIRDGIWKNHQLDGVGSFSMEKNFANGDHLIWRQSGQWSQGQLDGFGIETNEVTFGARTNQSRFEGNFSAGRKNGKGRIVDGRGNSFDGIWQDGDELQGVCLYPEANFSGPCKRIIVFDDEGGGEACLVPIEGEPNCIQGSKESWVH